jgi:hypothetical protein
MDHIHALGNRGVYYCKSATEWVEWVFTHQFAALQAGYFKCTQAAVEAAVRCLPYHA